MANTQSLFALLVLCLVIMIAPAVSQFSTRCEDQHKLCRTWAEKGECYRNAGFMFVRCPDTCGQCKVTDHRCFDANLMCVGWAKAGECKRNKPFMSQTCARACAFCTPANDHNVPHVHSNIVLKMWDQWTQKNPNLA